jgi:arabinofuranan 3-O-arabinosyltransferase
MCFPGFGGSLNLGQNAPLSLAVLLWGWVLVERGRDGWAGVVWGLLAYKPVWAASFFLVPLWTRRWRMAGAMLATGTALAVATLPVVGLGAWLDWLAVGRVASQVYEVNENWIDLSRDLLGSARRWLLDFDRPDDQRGDPLAGALGWAALLAVAGATTLAAWRRPAQVRSTRGPGAAFVLLAAWLCCLHFMYYDVLLAALPVAVLFAEPGRKQGWWPAYLLVGLVVVLPPGFVLAAPWRMEVPWDQYGLLLLWAWCGWRVFFPPAANHPTGQGVMESERHARGR